MKLYQSELVMCKHTVDIHQHTVIIWIMCAVLVLTKSGVVYAPIYKEKLVWMNGKAQIQLLQFPLLIWKEYQNVAITISAERGLVCWVSFCFLPYIWCFLTYFFLLCFSWHKFCWTLRWLHWFQTMIQANSSIFEILNQEHVCETMTACLSTVWKQT